MVHYKLTYFDLRGRAECIRMMFHYAGVEFEDVRIKNEDWQRIKPTMPDGKVPIFEEDGKLLTESGAIIRYIAKKFGFNGKTDWEAAKIEELYGWYYDTYNAHNGYIHHKLGYAHGDEAALYAVFLPIVTKVLEKYSALLKNSKSGFFLESGLSYADLIIYLHVTVIKNFEPELFAKYPVMATHLARINNIPQLKDYIASWEFSMI